MVQVFSTVHVLGHAQNPNKWGMDVIVIILLIIIITTTTTLVYFSRCVSYYMVSLNVYCPWLSAHI